MDEVLRIQGESSRNLTRTFAWPCAPAKVDLAEEYVEERLGLILYLTIQMLDAIDDSAANKVPDPADLHDRFLGWAIGTAPRRV
jgi:hypothetical protein